MRIRCLVLSSLFAVALAACGGDDSAATDAGMAATDAGLPAVLEVPPEPTAESTDESRARAFQLYYRERVERAVLGYNRFILVGDTTAATAMGRVFIKRDGSDFEIVPGPKDNNRIGTGAWMVYNAYRVFRSRTLELTLIRMFDGLVFLEAVSGHAGMTAREAYPGWTRVVDGEAGTATRTRGGVPVESPMVAAPGLEAEILSTFFDGIRITYRENPAEFLFSFTPAAEIEDYAITHSFSELPDYLRVTDCCSSLMRTPDTEPWGGAFWGNHNSRDNFPDLALGLVAAHAAAADGDASEDVRAAARRAVEAGKRVGDLIGESRSNLMTVDEHGDYSTLTVGGTVRPHGEMEGQDLGSLGVCSMAYLARALSTDGLASPPPELPLPGSGDKLFANLLTSIIECELPEGEVQCATLGQAYCGKQWSTMHHIRIFGVPLLQYLHDNLDSAQLFAAIQNDFDDVAESMLALLHYAQIVGDDVLEEEARAGVFYLTWLMQEMADTVLASSESKRERQRYQAALYMAQAALPVTVEDFRDFAWSEAEIADAESMLEIPNTTPAPLLTDTEIKAVIDAELATARDPVVARYETEYGASPPLRRAGDGYEARGTPEAEYPWRPVERPQHRTFSNLRLLHALPLCERAPQHLDCSWAALGCERPDLNADGAVDASDSGLFETAGAAHADASCDDGNSWCAGADLDRDGEMTDSDAAFMAAAMGCRYSP